MTTYDDLHLAELSACDRLDAIYDRDKDVDKAPALDDVAAESAMQTIARTLTRESDRAAMTAQLAELSQFPHALYKVAGLGEYGNDERTPAGFEDADVISSEIVGDNFAAATESHTLLVDLDVPARLVPSSTPGHSHLYVDVPMSWPHAVAILKALAAAGVVEDGYVAASIDRGHTAARLPWVRK